MDVFVKDRYIVQDLPFHKDIMVEILNCQVRHTLWCFSAK